MKSIVVHVGACLCLLAGTQAAAAAVLDVDDDNTTGTQDGSAAHPYATVQAAVAAAASSGDTIQIAAGTYGGGTTIERKEVKLLGGFVGGTADGYAAGTSGDFGTRNPATNVTRLTGTQTVEALTLKYTKSSVVDGLVLSDGLRGLSTFGEVASESNPTINNCLIENNGFLGGNGTYPNGAGVFTQKGGATLTNSVIRNNTGNRGAGLASFCDLFVATNNVIEGNIGHADHAGGIYLTGANITFSHNLIKSNECCRTAGYGWGGGGLIFQDGNDPPGTTKAVLSYNVWTDNKAASSGSAIFVDDHAEATFDHELVYKNRCSAHGEAIYVDGYSVGSIARFLNSTVVDNYCPDGTAGGIFVERQSKVTVQNSIFWNNGGKDFSFDTSGASLTMSYSISEQTHDGAGNLVSDPLFANAATGDYHLKSSAGRYLEGEWVTDAVSSPAIDAADPASPFDLEPGPNGGRANMGHYGNTCEASMGGPGGTPPSGQCADAPPPPPPFSDAGPGAGHADGGPIILDDGGVLNPGETVVISGGCGCRVGHGGGKVAALLLGLGAMWLVLRRRRRK
jgi:MYXO-CTERM domain-containing protein